MSQKEIQAAPVVSSTAIGFLFGFAIVMPVLAWRVLPAVPALLSPPQMLQLSVTHDPSPHPFERSIIARPQIKLPRISHVQITRLHADGEVGVLTCDAGQNKVVFYCQDSGGIWEETLIASNIAAPAHATVVDMNHDGELDLLISCLGNIEPDDGVIGSVRLLERSGDEYVLSTVLDDVRRVADVQPGDFDSDGDIDLAVAVFGYNRGQVLWLENLADGHFREHELLSAPGTIHVPVGDFDLDGDLDIAAIVTQDEEELWAFENVGGDFEPRRLWYTNNFDLGSAGLLVTDLDRDGDLDFILPAGDNLEDFDPFPQPYHGCLWFENLGDWQFEQKRISDFGGTYAAAAGDLDSDGDIDIALVSMAAVWNAPQQSSIVWLENDGQQNFKTWQLDTAPSHLVTVDIGDLNADGCSDIVAGGLHIRGPYDKTGRITAWINGGAVSP